MEKRRRTRHPCNSNTCYDSGIRQVIFFANPDWWPWTQTGKEIWRQKFSFKAQLPPHRSLPAIWSTVPPGMEWAGLYRIFKKGGQLLSKEIWLKPNDMFNHWSTPIYHEGHLYGMFSFKKYGNGPLQCIELKTERSNGGGWFRTREPDPCRGQTLALSDIGELAVVEASPSHYRELEEKR